MLLGCSLGVVALSFGLCDDVEPHKLAPGSEQLASDRPDSSVANRESVELRCRHQAVRRAGEEDFVSCVEVIGLQQDFARRNPKLLSQFKHRRATLSRQTIRGSRSQNLAVTDAENVPAFVLRDVSMNVENDTLGVWIDEV